MSASRPHHGHQLLRLQGLLLHPLRNRLLQGPRPSRQAHKEDREVPPPSMRPTTIMGPRRPRVQPIGYSYTTLHDTVTEIATALAKARPSLNVKGGQNLKTQETSKTAIIHDKQVAKTLLDEFCSLAQRRLLGIIAHRHKNQRASIH